MILSKIFLPEYGQVLAQSYQGSGGSLKRALGSLEARPGGVKVELQVGGDPLVSVFFKILDDPQELRDTGVQLLLQGGGL